MITKDMTIREILDKKPEAAEVFMEYGMGCLGCPSATGETLEGACDVHGLELEEMLQKLNS